MGLQRYGEGQLTVPEDRKQRQASSELVEIVPPHGFESFFFKADFVMVRVDETGERHRICIQLLEGGNYLQWAVVSVPKQVMKDNGADAERIVQQINWDRSQRKPH